MRRLSLVGDMLWLPYIVKTFISLPLYRLVLLMYSINSVNHWRIINNCIIVPAALLCLIVPALHHCATALLCLIVPALSETFISLPLYRLVLLMYSINSVNHRRIINNCIIVPAVTDRWHVMVTVHCKNTLKFNYLLPVST